MRTIRFSFLSVYVERRHAALYHAAADIMRRQHLQVYWRSVINNILKVKVSGQEQLFIKKSV
jgi:hypothetical protein